MEIENKVYEIKGNGCMLAFIWALIVFLGGISILAQIIWIDKGQTSFTEMLPWYILDIFILLFCFLIFKTDKVSLGVYPTYIKIGRSKIKWSKIKEIYVYKSLKKIRVCNHEMTQGEKSLINTIIIPHLYESFIGVKQIELLGSKKEFEEIIPFIEYYCETFKIKLTKYE